MKSYNYYSVSHNDWFRVLPDSLAFCHWGGREQSSSLIKTLNIQPQDKVLDICCGLCGTLSMIPQNIDLYGLDISPEALRGARKYLTLKSKVKLVQGDAFSMPFSDGYFDKLFAQDPDSFLSIRKEKLMQEIARVAKRGAKFVLQTYASTQALTRKDEVNINGLLRRLGYSDTETLKFEQIKDIFTKSGFEVLKIDDLHSVYSEDNIKMLKLARLENVKSLIELFEFERYLFSKRAWTGVMVISEKP